MYFTAAAVGGAMAARPPLVERTAFEGDIPKEYRDLRISMRPSRVAAPADTYIMLGRHLDAGRTVET
jgi:hypothetical protein